MDFSDKEFFANAFKSEDKRVRNCMYPGCKDTAINSHVFQKNGVLSGMSTNGHLIILEPPDIWKVNLESNTIPDISLHIRKRGVNDAYSFPGFCNVHDTKIFLPIEENISQVNFSEYNNQILFSYRGLCNELHRKIVAHAFQNTVFNKLLDDEKYDSAEYLSYGKDGMKAGIENLEKFKTMMENVLFHNENKSQFTFQTFFFPRLDIGISTSLSVLNASQTALDGVMDFKNGLQIPSQFINIFPIDDLSVVIIGEQSDLHSDFYDYLVDKFGKCSSFEEYQEILSDLITARLEFWCMDPNLFNTLDKRKLNAYIKFFTENINSHDFDLHSGINIFSH